MTGDGRPNVGVRGSNKHPVRVRRRIRMQVAENREEIQCADVDWVDANTDKQITDDYVVRS